MPEDHEQQERERKQRIKKLKARTSKMRLAVIKKKKSAEQIEEERYNKAGNFVSDTYVDDKGDMYAPKKSAAVKKKTKDQDEENEHNRDNYNAQSSVETGGDY